jgi:thiol:disulfide interchange protein
MTPARTLLQRIVLLILLLGAVPAAAQVPGQRHVAMRIVAESDTPAAGSGVALALVSVPDAGWHGYWQNPGAVGTQPRLKWDLPTGVAVGELRYPVPQRLLVAGLMNYVYERPWTLLTELRVPAGLAKGTALPVRLAIDYLVCTREICVPERATLATDLVVGDGAVDPARRAEFDSWRKALPRPIGSPAVFQAGDLLRLRVPFPADQAIGDAYFFAQTDNAIDYAAPQTVTRDGDAIVIATKGAGTPAAIEGVLATGDGRGFAIRAMPGTVAAPSDPSSWALAAVLAFAGALLGGLLLNVMPCVFPILSLKALSLARSGESDAKARAEGIAYTGGAVLTCMALGGILLAIRAAGMAAGWAFQLTDPRIVLLLLVLTGAIAFNLAGLFELPTPQVGTRSGRGGAFATGALAAFVATPCTGPFMGAALGSALVLPPVAAMAVFAGLGLGLALPFLLLGFVPALRRRLPRPGAWMDVFRKCLSVPMFLTALALAWILGRQAGVDGMALGLAALLLAGLGLWWTGRRQLRGVDRAWWPGMAALLVAVAFVGIVHRAPPAAATEGIAGAEPFSEARLAALQAEGKPVFAYFTADWCLTCKVNERTAIDTRAVADAFAKGGVKVLVGDWTDGDPVLGRFIEAHDRAGVPLYLWYAPGAKAPQVLPQVLTPGTLTGLVP